MEIGLYSLLVAALLSAAPSHDCLPPAIGPSSFEHPRPWGRDSGAVTYSFVDLRRGAGLFDVWHGADVSTNNLIDYDGLVRCGAKFAFVRIPSSSKGIAGSREQFVQLGNR